MTSSQRLAVVAALTLAAAACGSSPAYSGFGGPDGGGDAPNLAHDDSGAVQGSGDGGSLVGDGSGSGSGGSGDTGSSTGVATVYAHSADTLYRLDPSTKQVAVVGKFTGCSSVIDIAIDSSSNAFVTTSSRLYALDLASAHCTSIASGTYPNSLSFVPKGTLDPNAEALVGYQGATYVHIDTTTGKLQTVGSLSGGYQSSGDIVSVIGGGTFLTVKGGPKSCSDCLLQIDPKTGDLVQSYGSVNHSSVFGLAFWAGTAYGFDNAGAMFSIGWQNGALVTSDIPVPNPPPGLSFWGAGSTTAAPAMAADGGGIPIQ